MAKQLSRKEELVAAIEQAWREIAETGTMQPKNVGRLVFKSSPKAGSFKIAPADNDDDEALLSWLVDSFTIMCKTVASLTPKAKLQLYVRQDPHEYPKPQHEEFTDLAKFLSWEKTDQSEFVEWSCIISHA